MAIDTNMGIAPDGKPIENIKSPTGDVGVYDPNKQTRPNSAPIKDNNVGILGTTTTNTGATIDTGLAESMLKNLNEGFKYDKARIFGSRESYNNAYGYQTRGTQAEKDILDKYWEKQMGGSGITTTGTTPQQNITNVAANQNQVDLTSQQIIDQENKARAEEAANLAKAKEAETQYLQTGAELEKSRIKSAEEIQAEQQANLEQQQAQMEQYQAQYEQSQREAQDRATQTLQPLLEKEKAYNQALLDKQRVDDDAALEEAKIGNDIAMQQANVNFAKLGLTLSTGAVATSQRIFSQGARDIARLKVNANYNQANLAKNIGDIEFTHQAKINEIIDITNDNILKEKKNTISAIAKIKNDITLTKEEKQAKIDKAIDTYRGEKLSSSNRIYEQIKQSNKDLTASLEKIKGEYQSIQTNTQTIISTDIATGRIYSYSPQQIAEMERKAGLTPGSISAKTDSLITTGVRGYLDQFLGQDFVISTSQQAGLFDAIKRKLQLGGYSLERATTEVMNDFIQSSPRYQEIRRNKSKLEGATATLAEQKAKTEVVSQEQIKATVDKIRAETAMMPKELGIKYATLALQEALLSQKDRELALAEWEAGYTPPTPAGEYLSGQVTSYGGRVQGDYGVDITGKAGTPIVAPTSGNWEVSSVVKGNKTFGNYVIVKNKDTGEKVRYAHLNNVDVKVGDNVTGKSVGGMGNTGYVIPMNGGTGVHVDITSWDKSGKVRTGKDTYNYIKGGTTGTIASAPKSAKINERTLLDYAISGGLPSGVDSKTAKAYEAAKNEMDPKLRDAIDSAKDIANTYGLDKSTALSYAKNIASGNLKEADKILTTKSSKYALTKIGEQTSAFGDRLAQGKEIFHSDTQIKDRTNELWANIQRLGMSNKQGYDENYTTLTNFISSYPSNVKVISNDNGVVVYGQDGKSVKFFLPSPLIKKMGITTQAQVVSAVEKKNK